MNKRHAYYKSQLKTRMEADEEKYIEGYFAVFEQTTELWPGCFEKIARGAFDKSIKNNDIRCLFNHDSGFVLGRNTNNTLELRTDSVGLWAKVKLNSNDRSAMDIHARVERGDITGCSFGFNIEKDEYIVRQDGSVEYTITDADTCEISICTFPAYQQTEIQARQKDLALSEERKIEQRKAELKNKLGEVKC